MAGYWHSSFLGFYGPRLTTKKKKELGQYPAILTSRLVNNAFLLTTSHFAAIQFASLLLLILNQLQTLVKVEHCYQYGILASYYCTENRFLENLMLLQNTAGFAWLTIRAI